MYRFKTSHLFLLLGLAAPVSSSASHYCIAVDGGFGGGGTTFISTDFSVPGEGGCNPWAGFTKTASTVILMTSGAGCLSSDGKLLTVSVTSQDPAYLGPNRIAEDYITLSRSGSSGSFKSGSDQGEFSGSADVVTCTSSLEHLPSSHD